MRAITHLFIHCTATEPTAKIASIQAYWRNVLKWRTPGYHYVIDANGEVQKLLEESKPSNGVKGYNHCSIHLSYIGGMKNGKAADTRTPMQMAAMIALLKDLKMRYPNAKILGHRDISKDTNGNAKIDEWERIKECPSFEVSDGLKTVII